MSFQAQNWAVKITAGSPVNKMVLLHIANYADERGECYPSQERLAKELELSIRAVRDALAALEKKGIIRRERRYGEDGYRTSDRICLNSSYRHDMPVGPSGLPEGGAGDLTGTSLHSYRQEVPTNHQRTTTLSSLRSERGPPPAKAHRLPEDFTLTEQRYAKGVAKGLSEKEIRDEFEHFKDHFIGTGKKWVDWDRCWCSWLARTAQRRPRPSAHGPNGREASTGYRAAQRAISRYTDGGGADGRNETDLPF